MSRKNVLVVEDDGSALAFTEVLSEFEGFSVYKTKSWSDAEAWLIDIPGAESFASLVFDLRAPAYELEVYNGAPYAKEKDFYPALYFIEHFLRLHYPKLLNRIILYSAYFDSIKGKYDLNQFVTLDKREDGAVKHLISKIKEFGER